MAKYVYYECIAIAIVHVALHTSHSVLKTFEVAILDDPTTKAFTSKELFFHQDQGYYESTPGLQFLHCRKYEYNYFFVHAV